MNFRQCSEDCFLSGCSQFMGEIELSFDKFEIFTFSNLEVLIVILSIFLSALYSETISMVDTKLSLNHEINETSQTLEN